MYTRGRLTSYNEWDQGAFKNAVIRVGRDYQATIPPLGSRPLKFGNSKTQMENSPGKNSNRLKSLTASGGTCLWIPIQNDNVSNNFNKYLIEAKSLYDYNEEQALALLMWHFQEVNRAIRDLPNYNPAHHNWKKKEILLFFMAIREQNKNFNRIKRLFPQRKVGEMIQFYYMNKKKRCLLQSLGLFDPIRGGLIRYCNRDILLKKRNRSRLYNGISNVRAGVSGWRDNYKSLTKLTDDKVKTKEALDIKYAMPKDIHYVHQEFVEFCQETPSSIVEDIEEINTNVAKRTKELKSLSERIDQKEKSVLTGIEKFRVNESVFKHSQKWTKEDYQVVVQAVRYVGRDYASIADIVGSKTKSMVEAFLTANSRRFNLDELEAEFHRSKDLPGSETHPSENSNLNEMVIESSAPTIVPEVGEVDSMDDSADNLMIAL